MERMVAKHDSRWPGLSVGIQRRLEAEGGPARHDSEMEWEPSMGFTWEPCVKAFA
jgi:hypothetical protein